MTKIKPPNPDLFNCDGCGRTFHHSQREVTDGDEFCTNCAPTKVEFDEERVVNWKREKLAEAARDYRDAVQALTVARGITGELAPLKIEGPLVSILLGVGPKEIVVTEEKEAEA